MTKGMDAILFGNLSLERLRRGPVRCNRRISQRSGIGSNQLGAADAHRTVIVIGHEGIQRHSTIGHASPE
jgi:hypothetical protein